MAALCAQAGKPFIIQHDLENALSLNLDAGLLSLLSSSSLAARAAWYALISPDGVVGHYDRDRWAVEISSLRPGFAQAEPPPADSKPAEGQGYPHLSWVPLAGQGVECIISCSPPRHVTTPDISLDEALETWLGGPLAHASLHDSFAHRYVYLRGVLCTSQAAQCLQRTVFQACLETSVFGSRPFSVSMYASQRGLQTNLHVDEHSGFLVQVHGHKRVVLFGRRAKSLRCLGWGNAAAPINRRSWFHDGVPDEPGWADRAPFQGLGGCEVDVGPGQASSGPRCLVCPN